MMMVYLGQGNNFPVPLALARIDGPTLAGPIVSRIDQGNKGR